MAWQRDVVAEGVFAVAVLCQALDVVEDSLIARECGFELGWDVDFPEGLEAGDFIEDGVDIARVVTGMGFEGGDGLFEENEVTLCREEEDDVSHPAELVGEGIGRGGVTGFGDRVGQLLAFLGIDPFIGAEELQGGAGVV